MSKEAMKLALDALGEIEWSNNSQWQSDRAKVAITALREALAQPQPEPVAWVRKSDLAELRTCNYMRLGADSPSIWAPNAPDEPSPDMELVAVYISPPTRKPLTDEEIKAMIPSADGSAEANKRRVEVLPGVMGTEFDEVDAWSMPLVLQIARAIEAAHGIKEQP